MITELLIRNYALIEELHLKPHAALNIITGETGAGKSIMLGAIGLLLGNRADLKALLNTDEKCVVEASFLVWAYNIEPMFEELDVDYDDHTTIRREISPSGKSRAFINDTPVNLEALKKIGSRLIDIHSQHDNLLLGEGNYQLGMLDAYGSNQETLAHYQEKFREYQKIKSEYEALQQEHATYQKEFDYNQHLLEELNKANFQPGEQEALEKESTLLESSEEVKTRLNDLVNFLSRSDSAVLDELKGQVNGMGQIAELSTSYQNLKQRLDSCLLELQDISQELEREEEMVEFSPERIEEVNGRLSLIYNLQQKHQVSTLEELLQIREELEDKVRKVENFDETLQSLRQQLDSAQAEVMQRGQVLSAKRQEAIPAISQELKELLGDLGMPNATIEIQRDEVEPQKEGMDRINFLFSANKGIPPQEISRVASGGEFSRLMLAIKYVLADKMALPTIIFDEIDTGISGEIAIKMGNMFKMMAEKHQLISISHLHQIAAKGNHHYFVFKDDSQARTISRIRRLDEEERIFQIAQMISGDQPSESALLSAREMLNS